MSEGKKKYERIRARRQEEQDSYGHLCPCLSDMVPYVHAASVQGCKDPIHSREQKSEFVELSAHMASAELTRAPLGADRHISLCPISVQVFSATREAHVAKCQGFCVSHGSAGMRRSTNLDLESKRLQ